MKTLVTLFITGLVICSIDSCQESGARAIKPAAEKGLVQGKAVDANGKPLQNVQVTLSHTVWSDKKLYGTTDQNGNYAITLPAEPRGNWTIEAKHSKDAYGRPYQFLLDANDNSSFGGARGAIRNFTWRLLGEHIGGQYGGEVEVHSKTSVSLTEVKLIFTPIDNTLVDGSEAKAIEKSLELVNGVFRAAFVPLGRYTVQAIYKGKVLPVSQEKHNGNKAAAVDIVFAPTSEPAEAAFKTSIFIQP